LDAANTPNELQAVDVGHLQVRNDNIRPPALCNLQSSGGVSGRINRVTNRFQLKAQEIQDILRIIDEQYPYHAQHFAIVLPIVCRASVFAHPGEFLPMGRWNSRFVIVGASQ